MATETSGFFNAEQLIDGTYDRTYIAQQFAEYFKAFIGNGVFIDPTDQLKVVAVTGELKVKVLPGRAFVNGYWYYLDEEILLDVEPNLAAGIKPYSIQLRFDEQIRAIYLTVQNYLEPNRISPIYELQLAHFEMPSGSIEITDSIIVDDRPSDYCGFVKGLLEVMSTEDLFLQFTDLFTRWFDDIKGKLGDDPATNLQQQIDRMKRTIEVLITADGWTETAGIYTKSIEVAEILETDNPELDKSLNPEMTKEQVENYNDIFTPFFNMQGITSDGAITIILYEPLTANISVLLRGC